MSRMADRASGDRRSGMHDWQDGPLHGRAREMRRSQGRAGVPSRAAHGAGRRAPAAGNPPRLLDQRFDADSLAGLRAAVAAHAAAAGLSAVRVRDAVLAAHELAANAVCHGAGYGRVRQWADGQLLRCRVSDSGPASRIAAGLGGRGPWLAEYGHGLWLVSQVADYVRIGHGQGGTDVTITFAIDAA
jgi:anti-sigma regulatory factor (Ser/Thr protein kinase)